jgi:patatin-like phospholipase/acyl hydrolase
MKRILSIDGGGVKGVVPAIWLANLEQKIGPLHKKFDLIAGTSVGGIIACGISSGLPASQIVESFKKDSKKIFPSFLYRLWSRVFRSITDGVSAPKYDGIGLNTFLKNQFDDQKFGELKCFTLLPSFDVQEFKPVVFKSWVKHWAKLPTWEICRSSSSAPIYFPAHVIDENPYIDGAIVANNPTACAIAESRRLWGDEEIAVVSFGTGAPKQGISIDDALTWGAMDWATEIMPLIFEGSDAAMNYIAQRMGAKHFFRVEAEFAKHIRIDDTSKQAMTILEEAAKDKDEELLPILRLLQGNTESS